MVEGGGSSIPTKWTVAELSPSVPCLVVLMRKMDPFRNRTPAKVHVLDRELFEELSNVVEFPVVEKEDRSGRRHQRCLIAGSL